jgi:hypothetical protein
MDFEFFRCDASISISGLGGRIVDWKFYSCRQGVVAARSDYDLYKEFEGKLEWIARPSQSVRLLPPRDRDDFLRYHVRLPFELTDEEFSCLRFDGPQAVCATCYGPDSQDKSTNQDFGISGVISAPGVADLSFGIVCDGVSTGSFWSQRGAQIAAFGAFCALRRYWIDTARRGRRLDNDDARAFKRMMVEEVRDLVCKDRDHLLYSMQGIPEDFASQVFERNKDRREAWHNSTVIVTALSELGGLVAFAGDGGIYLRKTRSSGEIEATKCILGSSDEMEINSFVSPEFAEKDVRVGVISVEGCVSAEIVACTDGVDRTLRRAGRSPFDEAGELINCAEVEKYLEALSDRFPDTLEIDNYTLARVAWPKLGARSAVPEPAHLDIEVGSEPASADGMELGRTELSGADAEVMVAEQESLLAVPIAPSSVTAQEDPEERPSSDKPLDRREG